MDDDKDPLTIDWIHHKILAKYKWTKIHSERNNPIECEKYLHKTPIRLVGNMDKTRKTIGINKMWKYQNENNTTKSDTMKNYYWEWFQQQIRQQKFIANSGAMSNMVTTENNMSNLSNADTEITVRESVTVTRKNVLIGMDTMNVT